MSNLGFGQNCKPDYSGVDKFTKKQNTYFWTEIFKPGFKEGVMDNIEENTANYYINVSIGRFGDENYLQFHLKKVESSATAANFESALKVETGDSLIIAFEQGDPMVFRATKVQNSTKMDNVQNALVTNVSLDCKIDDKDLYLVEELSKRTITAIRFYLTNGLIFEKDVRGKRSKKINEKFFCATNYFKKNGYLK